MRRIRTQTHCVKSGGDGHVDGLGHDPPEHEEVHDERRGGAEGGHVAAFSRLFSGTVGQSRPLSVIDSGHRVETERLSLTAPVWHLHVGEWPPNP